MAIARIAAAALLLPYIRERGSILTLWKRETQCIILFTEHAVDKLIVSINNNKEFVMYTLPENISKDEITEGLRILANKINVDENGCHNYLGPKNTNGYGRIHFLKSHWLAHRLMFTLINGRIPADKVIDHICFNRACINPKHLQAISHAENCARRNPNSSKASNSKNWGIYKTKNKDKEFKVAIRRNYKLYHGGYFATIEEAIDARDKLEIKIKNSH